MFTYACAQEARPITTPEPKNQQVEYALPYPGILPDHPLYFLKNVRDWLLKIFISQPVRKTEFEMLLSDKSLNMAIFLADQGKKDLALKTLRISVDHLKTTESYLFEIPASEKPQINNIKDRFEKSLEKHQEIISNLSLVFSSDQQGEITSMLTELDTLKSEYLRKK